MEGPQDQVVIVTGAARGIGSSIARTLASSGARLSLADIDTEGVRRVAEDIRDEGHVASSSYVDISSSTSATELASRTLAHYGRIDAIVANAAIDAPHGLAWEIGEEHWDRIIDVNLSGSWWCARDVIPTMMTQTSGKIIFISSIVARLGSSMYSPAYAASKAGLLGLTVGLAAQLEGHGVRVNAIIPGPTGNTGTPVGQGEAAEYLASHPLGFGGPQPIADAVDFLLSSGGDWISGAALNVTGGGMRG